LHHLQAIIDETELSLLQQLRQRKHANSKAELSPLKSSSRHKQQESEDYCSKAPKAHPNGYASAQQTACA
jgi:hypothetical protein